MAKLKELSLDLKRIDNMIVDLTHRRMEIAKLVGFEKMRTGQPMFRSEIEDQRLDEISEYASAIGVNPNIARAMLYSLINESCKQQTILLQNADARDLELLEGQEKFDQLRTNLLALAEVVAPIYEDVFYGRGFFSQVYSTYENERLVRFASGLSSSDLALDLGCGTGHASILLSKFFNKIVGFDISQHMTYHATLNVERHKIVNVEFLCEDVENGLPFQNESVSFVNMNYGSASDFIDFPSLLAEVKRILKPGGGVFISFYNRDAISHKFGFLPWKTNMSSTLNPYTNCLEVSVDGNQFSIHAKPYTMGEVRDVLTPDFVIRSTSSYPFFSSFLPSEVLDALDSTDDLLELENQFNQKDEGFGGSYLICEATKARLAAPPPGVCA